MAELLGSACAVYGGLVLGQELLVVLGGQCAQDLGRVVRVGVVSGVCGQLAPSWLRPAALAHNARNAWGLVTFCSSQSVMPSAGALVEASSMKARRLRLLLLPAAHRAVLDLRRWGRLFRFGGAPLTADKR